MACWISASVALGFLSRNALAVRMTPFRQKPHWAACSSMKAFWMGCGFSTVPRPSRVVISAPATDFTGVMQERTARPFTMSGAGAALAEAAAEFRAAQGEVVAQGVEQRGGGVEIQGVGVAVDLESDCAHRYPRLRVRRKTARVKAKAGEDMANNRKAIKCFETK